MWAQNFGSRPLRLAKWQFVKKKEKKDLMHSEENVGPQIAIKSGPVFTPDRISCHLGEQAEEKKRRGRRDIVSPGTTFPFASLVLSSWLLLSLATIIVSVE